MLENQIEPAKIGQPKEESRIDLDIPGKIAAHIGSGRHAQASLAYYAIVYSFLSGLILSLLIYIMIALLDPKTSFVESVKSIWAIFIPIITLSLGYIFGKKD
jgi:hypothetical protein